MLPLEWAQVPLYALADRIWGGDVRHGRRYSIAIALGAGAGFGWLEGQKQGAIVGGVLALAWLVSRSLPFRFAGGSATPRKGGQFIGLVVRHALFVVPASVWLAFNIQGDPLRNGLTYGAWALCAGVLGLMYGEANARARDDGRPIQGLWNQLLELTRGALFGLARVVA